jgi:hypothetical protein
VDVINEYGAVRGLFKTQMIVTIFHLLHDWSFSV